MAVCLLTLLLTWLIGHFTIKATKIPYEPKFVFDIFFEDKIMIYVTNLSDYPIHLDRIIIKSRHRKTIKKVYHFNDVEHNWAIEPKGHQEYSISVNDCPDYAFPDFSKVHAEVTASGKTIKRVIPFVGG